MPTKNTRQPLKPEDDLTGQRFCHLVVVGLAPLSARTGNCTSRYWECRCDCGKTHVVRKDILKSGRSRSCGCFRVELFREKHPNRVHGLSDRPEYDAWVNMLSRCYNPDCESYPRYGGRGIRVCEQWKNSPEAFLADVGDRPSPKHSLDRIDNDGGYEPSNVRWSTYAEQNRNHSANIYIEHNGVRLVIQDWAARAGIKQQTLRSRLNRGWSVAKALTAPLNPTVAQGRGNNGIAPSTKEELDQ